MTTKRKNLPQDMESVSMIDQINFTTANGRELVFTLVSFGKEPLQTGWQKKENGLDYSQALWKVCQKDNSFTGLGVVHGLSGTTAFDIDDLKKTTLYFEKRFGDRILIEAILIDGSHIKSPSTNRDKVLYMVSDRQLAVLNAVKKNHVVKHTENGEVIFELRGAGGMDVFPPGLYLKKDCETDTTISYKHTGEYRHEGKSEIGMLPDELFQLQLELLKESQQKKSQSANKQTLPTCSSTISAAVIKEQEAIHLIRDDGTQSIVNVFNQNHSMNYVLDKCDYIYQGGNKWLSPNSTSGSAGIIVNQSNNNPWEIVFSNHATDGELYREQHDAFDIGAKTTHPDLSLSEAKKAFAKRQSTLLKAIDPANGNSLDITVDEYNKRELRKKQSSPESAVKKFTPITTTTGAELQQKDLPPISFVIAGLLPAGRTLLVASPKQGKSWLVLYLVILVAAGLPVFGRKVKPQKTVYFPLEDSDQRINSRASDIYNQFNISEEAKKNWSYALELASIGDGLEEALLGYLTKHPDVGFIVIDVLGKIRPNKESQSIYKADYAIGNALKLITDKCPALAILVVHHSNKGDKTDVISMVSGSNGLAGSFDNIFGIVDDKLSVNGRDLESQDEIELVKNTQGQYTMSAPDITNGMSGTRKTVYDFIENNSSQNKLVTPKEISSGTGLPTNDVNQQLKRLLSGGLITKPQRGKYSVT